MKYPPKSSSIKIVTSEFVPGRWYDCIHASSFRFSEGNSYLCASYGNSLYLVGNGGQCVSCKSLTSRFIEVTS